ncbi:unnamed protein product [Cladocopium goreaui]|uniref:Inversin n=1 Tax=Cladocopium goreaui TaxID=2562237 RepID=A0A9P1DWX4_9DINO|nr:unnamed protein product [Cladocopium goreaui]
MKFDSICRNVCHLGRTELQNAVLKGDENCVQQLLQNRASVDATDRSSRTALHLAANEVSGPSNIMRMLLEARASLMAKDVTGLTPMTLACQSNCQEAVAVLQSVMADQAEKLKDEAREEWNKFVFEIKALWESNKLKQVLEIQEQRFGKEDRDALSTKIDLAAVLQQQKDFTAAQQQLEEVFEGLDRAPSTNLKDELCGWCEKPACASPTSQNSKD